MKLEAVTVCVNVASELKYIVANRKLFDRWVVVTVVEDKETIALCEQNDIQVVLSQRVFADGAPFAKSRAINDGLSVCDRDGWLLLLDADIILPDNFREIFDSIPENEYTKQCIFGPKLRRMVNHESIKEAPYCTKNIDSLTKVYKHYYEWFEKEIISGESIEFERVKSFYDFIVESGFYADEYQSVEQQWQDFKSGEWSKLPINFEAQQQHILGYFQLFHHTSNTAFPEYAIDAHCDDVVFRNLYPKEQQKILDFEVVHVGMNSYLAAARKGQLITYPVPDLVTQDMLAPNDFFDYTDKDNYFPLASLETA